MRVDWPNPAELAERLDARYRTAERAVTEDRFAVLRRRIEAGLEWAVGALVTDNRGRVLLVYEDGRWLLPGGECEVGEPLEAAVGREVREETGLMVTIGDLLVVTEQAVTDGDDHLSFNFAVYEATPETRVLAPHPGADDEPVEAVAWVSTLPANTLDRPVLAELIQA